MARSAKLSASALVRAENRPPGIRSSGEFPSQMYRDAAIRGPGGGHRLRSLAGGLITAQSANDIVRDHRYTPSLLVRLNWCSCTLNQAAYPATGSAPASSAAATVTRPARRIASAAEQYRQQGQPDRPDDRGDPEQEGGRGRPGRPPLAR